MPNAALKLPNFAGLVFHKRFEFSTMLGSGSYGVVYKAIDLKARPGDRMRAIKLVHKKGRSPSWCESFRTEMALHKRASKHPNVITLHEAYEDDKWFVFVMDYCPGGDLAHYVEKNGPYSDEGKLRNAFLGLVDTVDWLHRQKIYHRDLKPHNVLVSEDGSQLFVADFGLASETNLYDQVCGTPAYMPPECLTEENSLSRSGEKTDTWALGVILINMMSANTPWIRATRDSAYGDFVENPGFLLECLPITQDTNRLLRRMLRANPIIRARLDEVRKLVGEVQQFFRADDDCIQKALNDQKAFVDGLPIEKMRSTMISEIEITNLGWAPNTRARQLEREKMRGRAVPPSTSSRTSSSTPTTVISPDGSVMVVKGECERKDITNRMKSVITRLMRVRS